METRVKGTSDFIEKVKTKHYFNIIYRNFLLLSIIIYYIIAMT